MELKGTWNDLFDHFELNSHQKVRQSPEQKTYLSVYRNKNSFADDYNNTRKDQGKTLKALQQLIVTRHIYRYNHFWYCQEWDLACC